jgi:OPA family glycerol-3-phosphate transporter-like MFS transporter
MDEKNMPRAVIVMGTTVATGTFFVYGLSALFVKFFTYTIMFFLAGILLPLIALLWIFAYPRLVKTKKELSLQPISEERKGKLTGLWIPIFLLAFFAVVDNLTKDGLTTWVPMILKEMYGLPDYVSILLTMLLPILAIFGTTVAVGLRRKIKDFVTLSAFLFVCSAFFISVVILCLPSGIYAITLGSFGVISCLMSGVNNVITSMAPLYWKERVNSGMLAGVLNGCCYLGSTLSAYGLGAIADVGGWNSVFYLLFGLCALSALLGVVYMTTKRAKDKKMKR